MKKMALFAFNGDPRCFVHVLLNAFDFEKRGYGVQIVIEGTATKLVKELHEDSSRPFATLYKKAKDAGLIGCVCQACAVQTDSKESALAQQLNVCSEMNGHPSVARYMEEGYQVLTF